jgi:hypothetical protein
MEERQIPTNLLATFADKMMRVYPQVDLNFQDVVFDPKDARKSRKMFCKIHNEIHYEIDYIPVCNILETQGISMIIDTTYQGFEQSKAIPGLEDIPYFQFDYTIRPFVNFMTIYLQARGATDVVFVFQSEKGISV